ncbi:MAG: tRNA lysidine(34) synthetase TilS [Candidatus Omnitrophota bacterium]|nr:tRNA lysidine(34) synthetase TilS [Candidatus Omnitrophota bacterium]
MILRKFKNTIRQYNLIKKNDTIVIGISGGPDSTALAYLLNTLKKELMLNLHIAHLDHMLRSDSGEDREFVEELSKKLKIPITAAKINIKESAKKGSLEEIARNARLGFLIGVAKKIKTRKIALGHNFDDQAETVLMRILRGTGLYGLSGILPKRNISGFEIIRPLIEIKKREIKAYLKKKGISPCQDITNLQDVYFRNKIRNRLLPLLEKEYNKNIKEVLANMAQSAGIDYDYLSSQTSRLSRGMKTKLKISRLQKLFPAIQRLIFRRAIAEIKGDTRRITFQHIKELEDLLLNRPVNSIVDLPKGISVIKTKKDLLFYRKSRKICP